jgi:hypothetical protein
MRQLLRRLWYLLRHRRFETDLAEEMAFHREMKRQELELAGIDPSKAEFAARFRRAALELHVLEGDRETLGSVWRRPRLVGHALRVV